MITAIHRFGEGPCKRVAFWYDDDGAPENMIEAQRVRMANGSTPQPGEPMRCGSCGAELSISAIDLLPGELDVRAK